VSWYLSKLNNPCFQALAKEGASVTVLTRPGSAQKTLPEGVSLVAADFAATDEVTAILKKHKIEVIVSTLGGPGPAWDLQKNLIDAAKKSGTVQIFVPSEFGVPTEGWKEGFPLQKANITGAYLDVEFYGASDAHTFLPAYAREQGVPTTSVYIGLSTEYIPWTGSITSDEGTFKIIGTGEKEVGVTATEDIAGFTAYVLTQLEPAKLKDARFRVEGDRITYKEAARRLYTGSKINVVHADTAGGPLQDGLQHLAEGGLLGTWYEPKLGHFEPVEGLAGKDNGVWKGHTYKSFNDVFGIAA
jgi:nucleoside-diphosphate-sugar epimerase